MAIVADYAIERRSRNRQCNLLPDRFRHFSGVEREYCIVRLALWEFEGICIPIVVRPNPNLDPLDHSLSIYQMSVRLNEQTNFLVSWALSFALDSLERIARRPGRGARAKT